MKNCIVRILGNDLSGIHGENQTFSNLEFTLTHEQDFQNTDKLYILNRIVNKEKRKRIINLLNKYNTDYLEIKFLKEDFDKWYEIEDVCKKWSDSKTLKNILKNKYRQREIYESLKYLNRYVININGARNFALDYCKKKYKWSFILDSNSFLLEDFNSILTNVDSSVEYIAIPQIRIHSNDDIFLPEKLNKYQKKEPQLIFKNTSKITFNSNMTYGVGDKAELLRVLNIPGIWDIWKNSDVLFGIKDRPKEDVKHLITGRIIRLSHYNKTMDDSYTNFLNRLSGLFNLIKEIREGKYD
jgi:hypothetical protein